MAEGQNEMLAAQEQVRIKYDKPVTIIAGKNRIKIRPIVGGALDKMSEYYTQQVEISREVSTPELIVKLKPNAKLQYKAMSVAILNDPRWVIGLFKIYTIHWLHWRILRWKYNQAEVMDVTAHIIEKMGLIFFFQNTALTFGLNSLKKKNQEAGSSEAKPV
jgi:hypothetical protein